MKDPYPSRGRAWWQDRRQSLFDLMGAAAVLAVAANAAVIEPDQADRSEQGAGASQAQEPWMGSQEVVYEVGGIARLAYVTIKTPTGTTEDYVSVPMRSESGDVGIPMRFASGDLVSISAQNRIREGAGTVTCRITVDGRVISEDTSFGLYATAHCEGNA